MGEAGQLGDYSASHNDHPALPSVLAYYFAPPLPHCQRILRVSRPFLYNIPMLNEAGAIKAQNVDTRGR